MFTGIVEERGTVVSRTGEGIVTLVIDAPDVSSGLGIGASIAVNGVCLTATGVEDRSFAVDIVAETLARTSLGGLVPGERVNLERALLAGGRFDGHIVQGHVDGVGTIERITDDPGGRRMFVAVPPDLSRYLVVKGSVTVDGVSLTVAGLTPDGFEVALIPHTLAVTTLGERRVGDLVDLEVDILAKYVERLRESS